MPWEFDATQVDPSQGSGQLPIGRHKIVIIADETVATKNDPNSGMLVLHCEVVEGEAKGQRGDYRLNLFHATSEDTKRIAYQQLSAICHVLGVYKVNMRDGVVNTAVDLHNKPFFVDVRLQEGSDKYTKIAAVYDSNGNPPTKGGQPQAQTQQQSAPAAQSYAPGPQSAAPAPGSFAPQQPAQPQGGAAPWNPPAGGQPAQGGAAPPWAR